MPPVVSVVIVHYNAGDDLRRCLASLDAGIGPISWDGVVVDNASTDGCGELPVSGDRMRTHRNPDNVGFARAVNQGIAKTAGDEVLILNPDCELLPGAVGVLRTELDRYPTCVVAGPRVVDPDGTIQGSARGDPTMFTGLFGRASLLSRLFPRSALADRNVRSRTALETGRSSVGVDWVAGSCMLARRDALETVAGFDERFFLYWEDADLCRRLRVRGGEVRYVPGATVVHNVGRSSRTVPARATRAFHASAYLYYTTHAARSPLNPARWFAKLALRLRCEWRLRRAGG